MKYLLIALIALLSCKAQTQQKKTYSKFYDTTENYASDLMYIRTVDGAESRLTQLTNIKITKKGPVMILDILGDSLHHLKHHGISVSYNIDFNGDTSYYESYETWDSEWQRGRFKDDQIKEWQKIPIVTVDYKQGKIWSIEKLWSTGEGQINTVRYYFFKLWGLTPRKDN